MSRETQEIVIDLDRSGKRGGIRVDDEKMKKTTGISLSSSIGVGNFLRVEGFATRQMIRSVITLLERLIGEGGEPDRMQHHRGFPVIEDVTIAGIPLTDLDSVSLIISKDDVVRLTVVKQVEEVGLTLYGQAPE